MHISFRTPEAGETIYYTLNGSEPNPDTSEKYVPGQEIPISKTSILRAQSFADGKIPGNILTHTYFINEREFDLTYTISVVTEDKNLYDEMTGIYVVGKNGIPGVNNGQANYNRNWRRPANFEMYDKEGNLCLNQELDISVSGGYTRTFPLKSLKISPRKKFGDNRLRYDVFSATKPNRKFKDILLRNSGNDFGNTMIRDAFMQSLVAGRMDIDYQAYEPAVYFLNGVYSGIINVRERTNKDYLYTNYGLDEEDIYLLETTEITEDIHFQEVTDFLRNNHPADEEIYRQACEMIDTDSYIDYLIAEMYYANYDWPQNNFKVWKKKTGGKWRWILLDTDYGYNYHDLNGHNNHNPVSIVFNDGSVEWCTYPVRRLILNETFKNKFIDRFCIHMASTFATERVIHIMDSISGRIANEIVYHKNKWGSARGFTEDLANMKNFAALRPGKILNDLGKSSLVNSSIRHTLDIRSNIPHASYLFNTETIRDSQVILSYFGNRAVTLKANPLPGYNFKHWEQSDRITETRLPVPMGSTWKYWDLEGIPAANWHTESYNDQAWKSGEARLGYGGMGEKTTIGYGDDPDNKYPTAYFRKTFRLTNPEEYENFTVSVFMDDGAAVYINGTEIGRHNLPSGSLSFHTLATMAGNGVTATFPVDKSLLKEGTNLLAVEVHQVSVKSTDLIFDLSLSCQQETGQNVTIYEHPVFSTVLTSDVQLTAIYEEGDPLEVPEIVINEIVASNTEITDEYGDTDDYIELYNVGETDINMAGWYISDKPENPVLYEIPATDPVRTLIPAKGRIILWADGEPHQGILHTNFSLSKDGETLVLSYKNADETLVEADKVTFPALPANMSYARVPDGSDTWVIQPPTFNEPNSTGSMIQRLPSSPFLVYPTKVTDHITVENAENRMIRIYTFSGHLLYASVAGSGKEKIDMTRYPEGMYILTIENIAYKVIKME